MNEIRVKKTAEFKLKDKPTRQFQAINLEKQFDFKPDVIIVEKVFGKSNTLRVLAVLTEDEIKKDDIKIKNLEKQIKNVKQKSTPKKGKTN